MKGCLNFVCRVTLVLAVLIAATPALIAILLFFIIEELEES